MDDIKAILEKNPLHNVQANLDLVADIISKGLHGDDDGRTWEEILQDNKTFFQNYIDGMGRMGLTVPSELTEAVKSIDDYLAA